MFIDRKQIKILIAMVAMVAMVTMFALVAMVAMLAMVTWYQHGTRLVLAWRPDRSLHSDCSIDVSDIKSKLSFA